MNFSFHLFQGCINVIITIINLHTNNVKHTFLLMDYFSCKTEICSGMKFFKHYIFQNQRFHNPQLLYIHAHVPCHWSCESSNAISCRYHNNFIKSMFYFIITTRQVAVTCSISWILHVQLHMNTTLSTIYAQLTYHNSCSVTKL